MPSRDLELFLKQKITFCPFVLRDLLCKSSRRVNRTDLWIYKKYPINETRNTMATGTLTILKPQLVIKIKLKIMKTFFIIYLLYSLLFCF